MRIHTLLSVASLVVATHAQAQLINVPVEIPMPIEVDPINFGVSLAVGNGSVFVGGVGEQDTPPLTDSGVYEFDLETLSYIRTMVGTADNPDSDFFGFSMEYASDKLWVGAPLTMDDGDQDGAAYVFDPTTGNLLNRFDASSTFGSFGLFGYDLSVSGSAIMVGAPGFDDGGQVYIYNPINYSFFDTFGRDTTTNDFNYGWQVQHNEQYVVVSAPGDLFFSNGGAVYVYDFNTGFRLYRLTSPITDFSGSGEFGKILELENDTLLVSWGDGAPFDALGKVAMFDLTSGSLVALLDGDTSVSNDGFGSSMSIEGSTAVIGAPNANDPSIPGPAGMNRGAIYLFDLTTATMIEKIMLPASTPNRFGFGSPSIIQDGTIVASSGTDIPGINRTFVIKQFCKPDINLDGNLNFLDVSAFLKFAIDFNEDGSFNFLDISAFLQSFAEGCP
ncbi:MAG: hypothetical protein RLN78_08970 [Phycisphaerales bacterium]